MNAGKINMYQPSFIHHLLAGWENNYRKRAKLIKYVQIAGSSSKQVVTAAEKLYTTQVPELCVTQSIVVTEL